MTYQGPAKMIATHQKDLEIRQLLEAFWNRPCLNSNRRRNHAAVSFQIADLNLSWQESNVFLSRNERLGWVFRTADDVVRKVPAPPNVSPQVSDLKSGLVAPFIYAIGLKTAQSLPKRPENLNADVS